MAPAKKADKKRQALSNGAFSKEQFLKFIRIRYLSTGKGRRIVKIPRPFLFDYQIQTLCSTIFSSFFRIKFGETKQIVITFVTTTLKALISVAKTNSRHSGREFHAGNIYNLFWNILAHISSYQHIKSAPTEVSAPKNAHSNCRQTISS